MSQMTFAKQISIHFFLSNLAGERRVHIHSLLSDPMKPKYYESDALTSNKVQVVF